MESPRTYTYKSNKHTPKSRRKTLQNINKEDELLFKEKPKQFDIVLSKLEENFINMFSDMCSIESFMYNVKDTREIRNTFDNINMNIMNIISDNKIKRVKQIKCIHFLKNEYTIISEDEWSEKCLYLKSYLDSKNDDGLYINDCTIHMNKNNEYTLRGLKSYNEMNIKKNEILEKSINRKFELIKLDNSIINELLNKLGIKTNYNFYVKNNNDNNKGLDNFLQFLKIPFLIN
jgi:hypothetical protein